MTARLDRGRRLVVGEEADQEADLEVGLVQEVGPAAAVARGNLVPARDQGLAVDLGEVEVEAGLARGLVQAADLGLAVEDQDLDQEVGQAQAVALGLGRGLDREVSREADQDLVRLKEAKHRVLRLDHQNPAAAKGRRRDRRNPEANVDHHRDHPKVAVGVPILDHPLVVGGVRTRVVHHLEVRCKLQTKKMISYLVCVCNSFHMFCWYYQYNYINDRPACNISFFQID